MDETFVYFVIDYFATGEGRTIWLYVNRVWDQKSRELARKDVEEWSGWFYANGITEVTQEQFFGEYGHLVPEHIAKMILGRQAPSICFKQEFHFNFS